MCMIYAGDGAVIHADGVTHDGAPRKPRRADAARAASTSPGLSSAGPDPIIAAATRPETARVPDPDRRAAPIRRDRARPRAERVPRARAALHGRHLPVGEHEAARRIGRARHGGAGGIWRARAAGLRHRAGARGDRQGLLRDRDGGAGRGRRADPHHLDLRAGGDQARASCRRCAAASASWRSA